ncbi:SDR family oxidoreductase [Patulibacter medicamentivorans]|uniref:SDR family oxidoreductase n=1 Tax=Patulibacter medicamentivorans TaxID=1097667 RepID=UPI0006825B92|nr:SDR family oxidoreductase [Patulibacter medicamentivorans]
MGEGNAHAAAAANARPGTVLVAGAGGVIGGYAAAEYARQPGWRVRALSRRRPVDAPAAVEHLAVDLLDAAAAADGLRAAAADTTHLVFAAYAERLDLDEQVATNLALLRNVLDALRAGGAPLRHVTLYQGMKAYGAHLGPFKTPSDERDPRLLGPNFYYDQEDLLRERAAADGWSWTILRPEGVIGHTVGTPMNLLLALVAYAAICQETGVPLRFPGTARAYDALYQVSDAELLARATVWSGGSEAARGEVFNVTNGDVFRWRQLWPRLADAFGLEIADPQPLDLPSHMRGKGGIWRERVRRRGLRDTPWEQVVDWRFGQFILGSEDDNISNTTKLRRAGFHDCYDTLDRMSEWFRRLQDDRVV